MSLKKILKFTKKFLSKHWKKWTILVVLGMLVYIGFIFYEYIYKPLYYPREVTTQKLEIKKEIYHQIMNSYLESQENLNKIISKEYQNPFK